MYTLQYIPYTKELSRPETSQGQGLPTSLSGDFLKKHFHPSLLANKLTTKYTNITGFPAEIFI